MSMFSLIARVAKDNSQCSSLMLTKTELKASHAIALKSSFES